MQMKLARKTWQVLAGNHGSGASTRAAATHGMSGWIALTISGVEVVARCGPALHARPGGQLTAVVDTAHLH